MINRIKALFFEAAATWDKIRDENESAEVVFKKWVLLLAAIPAVVRFLVLLHYVGAQGIVYSLTALVTSYVAGLGGTFLLAWIVDFLASKFGGTPNFARAYSVVAYSLTPSYVASIFGLLPLLGILSLAGAFWSIWLLRLALPRLMGAPEEQAVPYTAVVVLLALIVGAILAAATGAPFMAHRYTAY